jgi:hypothetical protein
MPPRHPHQKSRRFGQLHRSLRCYLPAGLRPPPESRSAPSRGPRSGTNEELPPCCQSPSKQPSCLGGGVAIFGRKGATRHGRHRFHSTGDSRGARRLLRRQAVEDEGPMGHRVAEPGLSTLRHVNARDPQARINCGSDVGRMDVPEMRLQGRQVWARAGCTLRRHVLLTYGSTWLTLIMSRDPHGSATIGSHRSRLLMEPVPGETPLRLKRSDGRDARGTTPPMVVVAEVQAVGAVVPGLSQPLRNFEPVPDDRWSLQPAARRAEPATMNQAANRAGSAKQLPPSANKLPLQPTRIP